MFYNGYDTDDLTVRQNYVFRVLKETRSFDAVAFIKKSVQMNFDKNMFDNYIGDCIFLTQECKDKLAERGYELTNLYE